MYKYIMYILYSHTTHIHTHIRILFRYTKYYVGIVLILQISLDNLLAIQDWT